MVRYLVERLIVGASKPVSKMYKKLLLGAVSLILGLAPVYAIPLTVDEFYAAHLIKRTCTHELCGPAPTSRQTVPKLIAAFKYLTSPGACDASPRVCDAKIHDILVLLDQFGYCLGKTTDTSEQMVGGPPPLKWHRCGPDSLHPEYNQE